jgi:hypothetical protein
MIDTSMLETKTNSTIYFEIADETEFVDVLIKNEKWGVNIPKNDFIDILRTIYPSNIGQT